MIDRTLSHHTANRSLQALSLLPVRGNQCRIRHIALLLSSKVTQSTLTAVPSIKAAIASCRRLFPSYGRAAFSRFASAPIAFRIADSTFSIVYSSHPASHINVLSSSAVSSTSPKISLRSVILRASLHKIFIYIPSSPLRLNYHTITPFFLSTTTGA